MRRCLTTYLEVKHLFLFPYNDETFIDKKQYFQANIQGYFV